MGHTAIRIASLVYDAAARRFEAALEFFAPGVPVPIRVGVTYAAPPGTDVHHLTRGLVARAQRQMLR